MMSTPDRDDSATVAAALVALYVLAEQQLLDGATRILRRTSLTADGTMASLGALRRLVARVLGGLSRTDTLTTRMVAAAAREGTAAAIAGSAGGGGRPPGTRIKVPGDSPFDLSMSHGARAAQAIRDDVVSELADVRSRITRLPDDLYKMIAPHGAIYQVLENGVSPAQAQAMAWRVFVSQGITGFTDRAGRDWSLSAYVEMAVRTAATRAYNDSHLRRMRALGVEYFTVPDTGRPCPKCFPWQGRVLTATRIENPVVPVAGTIADAAAAGLWHPACRHPLTAFYPSVTVLPEPREWTAEDQRLYDLTQRQRRLELAVRKAKRQAEYALTPEARQEATARVRRAQANVRQFITETGFLRDTRREQVDLTDERIKLPTPIR